MTVKQLKQAIADLPDHMDVFMGVRDSEFDYALVGSAEVKNMDFFNTSSDKKPMGQDKVLVIEED